MKKVLHPATSRGTADFGWLKANYSFSFANYFNPDRIQFGLLRVLNDDVVGPGMGFGKHPHQNMEIVTIPLEGALRHEDSMGNNGVIHSGEVQVMSAGKGVEHSEKNASLTEAVKLFQIWIFPEMENVEPRYDQKKISSLLQPNTLSAIVKPKSEANDTELWLHQQVYFNLGEFIEDTKTTYTLHKKNHGIYLLVIKGTVIIENETLTKRDAIGLWDTPEVQMTVKKDSKVLLIEIPMN